MLQTISPGSGEPGCAVHSADETLVAAFERQVAARPADTAVDALEGRWSYQDLDSEANAIANILLSISPTPGEPIGVALGYCREMVAAVIGILKAGKFYVPIEITDGSEQQRSLVRACGIRCVLTLGVDSSLTEILRADEIASIPIAERTRAPSSRPDIVRQPEMLSYCIFTSGSSGVPKRASSIPMPTFCGISAPTRSRCNWTRTTVCPCSHG